MIESSSSGIPQHWQISFLGSPSSVLIETSNSLDNSLRVSVFGTVSPFSQRDTACLVTITFSASSSWDQPLFVRSSKITFLVSIAYTSVIGVLIITERCFCGKQPAVSFACLHCFSITSLFRYIEIVFHLTLERGMSWKFFLILFVNISSCPLHSHIFFDFSDNCQKYCNFAIMASMLS